MFRRVGVSILMEVGPTFHDSRGKCEISLKAVLAWRA